jgi:hypothetical protein
MGCWCDIQVSIDHRGGYNISVNNYVWLRSSHTALYVDNKWYSSNDSTLPLTSIAYAGGNDPFVTTFTQHFIRFVWC